MHPVFSDAQWISMGIHFWLVERKGEPSQEKREKWPPLGKWVFMHFVRYSFESLEWVCLFWGRPFLGLLQTDAKVTNDKAMLLMASAPIYGSDSPQLNLHLQLMVALTSKRSGMGFRFVSPNILSTHVLIVVPFALKGQPNFPLSGPLGRKTI